MGSIIKYLTPGAMAFVFALSSARAAEPMDVEDNAPEVDLATEGPAPASIETEGPQEDAPAPTQKAQRAPAAARRTTARAPAQTAPRESIQLPASAVDDYRIQSQYGPEKSVLNSRFPREGKLEVGAGFGYSGASSLMRYMAANGSLVYHLSQRHALEPIWFSYAWSKKTKFVDDQIAAKRPSQSAALSVELPQFVGAASYLFSPYYAKMHITERKVTHFDVYLGAGVGFLQEKITYLDGRKGSSKMRPGVSLAAGLRFLMPPRWALRFEFRDIIHSTENLGSSAMANNIQLTAGLSIFFGRFPRFE